MLRRNVMLGIAVLSLIVVPAVAAEADAKAAKSSSTTNATSSTKKQTAEILTFTNADIDALPTDGNSTLPSLEDDADAQAPPNRFVIVGTPAPEGETAATPAPVDPEAAARSMEWVEQMLAERERAARISAAQRRMRLAESKVAEIERTYRPKGSAFSEGGGNTDRLFMRGVTSRTFKYDDAIRAAYIELAEARAELDELLAQRAARPEATNARAS